MSLVRIPGNFLPASTRIFRWEIPWCFVTPPFDLWTHREDAFIDDLHINIHPTVQNMFSECVFNICRRSRLHLLHGRITIPFVSNNCCYREDSVVACKSSECNPLVLLFLRDTARAFFVDDLIGMLSMVCNESCRKLQSHTARNWKCFRGSWQNSSSLIYPQNAWYSWFQKRKVDRRTPSFL